MSRRAVSLVIAAALVVALVVTGFVLPVPYVREVPGPPVDTLGAFDGKTVVQVPAAARRDTGGHIYLTDVSLPDSPTNQPVLFSALKAWFDPHETVLPVGALFPPDVSAAQVQQMNETEMAQSQQSAVVAAERALGYRVDVTVTVAQLERTAPASAVLKRGDAITAVNGTPVTGLAQLRKLIAAVGVSNPVTLTIRRNGQLQEVRTETIDAAGRAIVGFTPGQRINPQIPVTIGISPQQIGGPSAGLTLALAIVDRLTPGSLTGGKTVAGTGTIDDSGQIGEIGGVVEKVAAARNVGATVFLSPVANCKDATAAAPDGIRVVPVQTLGQALSTLAKVRAGKPLPSC